MNKSEKDSTQPLNKTRLKTIDVLDVIYALEGGDDNVLDVIDALEGGIDNVLDVKETLDDEEIFTAGIGCSVLHSAGWVIGSVAVTKTGAVSKEDLFIFPSSFSGNSPP